MAAPNPGGGIEIELESDVKLQFGSAIEKTVREELARLSVEEPISVWWTRGRWTV